MTAPVTKSADSCAPSHKNNDARTSSVPKGTCDKIAGGT
ncbi:MAG: hypothetical protein IPN81_12900 [Nitrosomonadales bacterium]|nr:hypothetical protein [Nitrosomonadales bacterium]